MPPPTTKTIYEKYKAKSFTLIGRSAMGPVMIGARIYSR
jgi:hypothetical protein